MSESRWTRRALIRRGSALPLMLTLGGAAPVSRDVEASPDPESTAPHPGFPRQEPARVRDTVLYAHFDLKRVRELVEARPALARATWDWGFGDWESALGGASHTGQREIAEYLIRKGARPNLFSAAMLGQLEVVRSYVAANPAYASIEGPHGIPLIDHARAGGADSAAVVEFLEGVGDAARSAEVRPLEPAELSAYVGSFRYGRGGSEMLDVIERDGTLAIRRGESAPRQLINLGDHRFHPVGARAVRIVFEVSEGSVRALVVHDPDPLVRAVRVSAP